MRSIRISGSSVYDVLIQEGLLDMLADYFPAPQEEQKILLVADSNTAALYGDKVLSQFANMGYLVHKVVVAAGEASKTLDGLQTILRAAFDGEMTRHDLMVALGGGVIGDLCGFAAAIYMRGIGFWQIPTTLLAQVDASVGGKTAIDCSFGKNLIGAFHQPEGVLIDPLTLKTLPDRELANGMAEVIKYALLDSEDFFHLLENTAKGIPSEEIIARCVQQKARVVHADEKEQGVRAVLNLGHSFGHALEKTAGFGVYSHGEAVGIGLLCALFIGERLHISENTMLPRVLNLLRRWRLPTTTAFGAEALVEALRSDKKRSGSTTRFVLMEEMGKAIIHKLSDERVLSLAKGLEGFCLAVAEPSHYAVRIKPSQLKGKVFPPPSKSVAHRQVIAASLALLQQSAEGSLREQLGLNILNYEEAMSKDIEASTRTMGQLLDYVKRCAAKTKCRADALAQAAELPANAQDEPAPNIVLDCGESGSTIRFLIPIAAALGVPVTFTGSGRLPWRPLNDYQTTLAEHGITLEFPNEEGLYLPLKLSGRLTPGVFSIAGDSSSQYISGMLFALCLLDKPSTLCLTTSLESAPYVELTLDTLRQFGQDITVSWKSGLLCYQVCPTGGLRFPKGALEIERDYSQAAFWYLAAYLGHDIQVAGMRLNSLQGDKAIIHCLEQLDDGRRDKNFDAAQEIDVSQFPDIFPELAVAAAAKRPGQQTHLVNASRLRIKESDRLHVTCELLCRLGVEAKESESELCIYGNRGFSGAKLASYGDHRQAMVSAIAALSADGECILYGADAIRKSYPAFFTELRRLGAEISIISEDEAARK